MLDLQKEMSSVLFDGVSFLYMKNGTVLLKLTALTSEVSWIDGG
jgi:hypothetical protein